MTWTKTQLTAAVAATLLLAGVTAIGVIGQERRESAGRPAVALDPPAKPAAQGQPADPVRKLQQERLNLLKKRLEFARIVHARGAAPESDVKSWEEQVTLAEAELSGNTAAVRTVYERRLALVK